MATRRRRASSPADRATKYAKDVAAGKIVAGPHVRDACARHLRDLTDGEKRGLNWDRAASERAIEFFAVVLRLAGGEFEGRPFELQGWQAFIVGSLFGWKGPDGYRRFRVAYVETGKGSGKSPLAAGIGIYGMVADNEPRAEVYAAATKKDQAMVLFRDAVAMVDHSPELSARITKSGVGVSTWNLTYAATMSFFRPISSDEGQSGPRPHIALLDEIHEHRNADVVEVMRAGTKGRRQSLIFMITNSGVGQQSFCRERHDYAARVSGGLLEDDSFFGYVCALDEGDEPFDDPKCWIKANPSLGVTIQPKYLEEQVREARGMPSKESLVRRLNFCQWVEAHDPWLGADVWTRCQWSDEEVTLTGRRCWGGLDLSTTTDLTAFVLLWEPSADDPLWRIVPTFWLPEDGLRERERKDRVPYSTWARSGYLQLTPGRAIDKRWVAARIAEQVAAHELQEVGFDRWGIEAFQAALDDDGITLPLVPFGQGYKDMTPAVNEFERLLVDAKVRVRQNPVMTWCAANAVTVSDPAGNRKVAKDKATGRVDGVVAAIMAVGRSMVGESEGPSVYESRGVIVL